MEKSHLVEAMAGRERITLEGLMWYYKSDKIILKENITTLTVPIPVWASAGKGII
jgi:hypothetical protein